MTGSTFLLSDPLLLVLVLTSPIVDGWGGRKRVVTTERTSVMQHNMATCSTRTCALSLVMELKVPCGMLHLPYDCGLYLTTALPKQCSI